MPFFSKCVADQALPVDMSGEDKESMYAGLRDLFIASSHELLSASEKVLLITMTDLLPADDDTCLTVDGLLLCPFPNQRQKAVRFVEVPGETNPLVTSEDDARRALGPLFVSNKLGQVLLFADATQLSYHNLENILPLDRFFRSFGTSSGEPLTMQIRDFCCLHPEKAIYGFRWSGSVAQALTHLDESGAYIEPLNAGSRGGRRAIFRSRTLSTALDGALRSSSAGLPANLLKGFQFVNHVFRLNRFEVGDRKFSSHLDTPYVDRVGELVSRFTLLLYVTGGQGSPALRIADALEVTEIKELSGVIFDQRLEHEGHAFDVGSGAKVFVRCELVYHTNLAAFDAGIAKCFSSACYLTKESVFNPELDREAAELFNRAVRMRHRLCAVAEAAALRPMPQLLKSRNSVAFVTDGCDYWFPSHVDVKTAALLTIVDYFGGTVQGSLSGHLNKKKRAKAPVPPGDGAMVLNPHLDNDDAIFALLAGVRPPTHRGTAPPLAELSTARLLDLFEAEMSPPAEEEYAPHRRRIALSAKGPKDEEGTKDEEDGEDAQDNHLRGAGAHCCAFCLGRDFEPLKCPDVLAGRRTIARAVKKANTLRVGSAAIFNGQLFVNADDLEVGPSAVTFPRTGAFRGINFASCWNGCPLYQMQQDGDAGGGLRRRRRSPCGIADFPGQRPLSRRCKEAEEGASASELTHLGQQMRSICQSSGAGPMGLLRSSVAEITTSCLSDE